MNAIHLTPASISYLAQFVLSLTLTVYLLWRLLWRKQGETEMILFTGFIFVVAIFSGLLFLDTALLPTPRLYAVYLENFTLAIGLVFLFQFLYRFPVLFESRKWEARIVLALSAAYALYEIYFAIYRFTLLRQGIVEYRIPQADYALVALFVWIPIAFLRQCILADERPAAWFQKLWNPQGAGARALREFAILFLIPLALGIANILRTDSTISTKVFNLTLSLGILGALWLLVIVYLNSQPAATSFLINLSGTTLALMLAIFGATSWVITPAHIAVYHPALTEHQSLRFTPNSLGGYDIAEVPFYFETNLGGKIPVTSRGDGRSYKVGFTFPFYGKTYSEIYVTSVGLVKMGEALYHPNLQHNYGQFPAIFALLIDLEPDSGGGVFVRSAEDRLVVTWNELPAVQLPDAKFTFQTVLYRDGRFDINYKDLPAALIFNPDTNPSSNIWLRGATPGTLESAALTTNLSAPVQSGAQGILQDFNIGFREYLHEFSLPLGWLLILTAVILFVLVPFLLNTSIVKPLNTLLTGVQQMDNGDLDVEIPIQHFDEIGLLTQSFNSMAIWLKTLINGLEQSVGERTAELELTNSHLQLEMSIRQASQTQLIEKQRALAILDERERMSRELHDGLAQVMSSINLQTQAAQIMFDKGQHEAANASLARIAQMSQDANADIRSFILELREPPLPESNLFASLEEYLNEYSANTGIETNLSLPVDHSLPALGVAVEEQILHVIQEALTNIHKHARARRAEVMLSTDERSIHISISDDGIGFDESQTVRRGSHHFGLKMMRERVEMLGGRIEIRSAPRRGTKILVFIPRLAGDFTSKKDTEDIKSLRLLLVDDSLIFLEGLSTLLDARGLTVVGVARDGLEAQEKARQLHPDMIVMDVIMPRCSGIEATLAIKAEFPEIKIVMLTSSEKEEHLLDAIKNGASGFLLKGADANEFCTALEKLAQGETILPPGIAAQLITELSHTDFLPASNQKLSERQQEILDLVASGMTYKEVGLKLHLSEKTIKYHMAQILERLHLKNRSQAFAFARRVVPEPEEPL